MVPSSFITSHITALGFNLASFEISTDASVCPALSNTPPFLRLREIHVLVKLYLCFLKNF